MSMYAPKPISSFCENGNYYECRVYTSFINRKYYLVARRAATTTTIRFTGTAYFPPADDVSSSYYKTYIGFTYTNDRRYYHIWENTRSGVLIPSTPTYSYKPMMFGWNLRDYSSGFLISVNMNGRTLYSKARDYGEFQGSYLKLVMSGFTSLFGCGVTLSNRPFSFYEPFYCEVQSSN